MKQFKIHNSIMKYLTDKDLSLNAKGFLTIVLFSEELPGIDIAKYCSDTEETIKDALLELRLAKYVKYDPETNVLMAGPDKYPEWDEAITKDLQRKARKHAEQER